MNLFDLVAGLVLAVSALIGLARGAILEVVALFAFAGATAVAVYLLPYTTPLAVRLVHPAWAASPAAAAVSFLVAYLGLRMVGSGLSRSVKGHGTLGALDRTLGLAFGVARALVVLGVVYLVFSVAPADQQPTMLTQARLYPLARGAGTALSQLAPGGIHTLQTFGGSLREHMSGVQPEPPDAVDAEPPSPSPAPLRILPDGPAPRRHRHRTTEE